MKFRSKLFALLATATFASSSAFALVDHFGGVKFGSDFASLEKANVCHWDAKSFKPSWNSRVYHCNDFRIEGINHPLKVYVEFTDGKLMHAGVNIPKSDLEKVAKILKAKYGAPKRGVFKGWKYYDQGDVMIAPSSAHDMYELVYKGIDKSL